VTLTVADVRLEESPERRGWARLSARLHSDVDGRDEPLWLDVPASDAAALRVSGDPFLAWLAPLAATRGEALRIESPVDAQLLAQVREVLRIWRIWYPQLTAAPVTSSSSSVASQARADAPPAGNEGLAPAAVRTASMFTGGVDSFFTVLRHDAGDGTPSTVAIDDLLYVHGFDVSLANTAAAHRVQTSLQQAADALGKRFVFVATNLRDSAFGVTDWPRLAHGAALAGVAHALSGAYRTVLLGSSAGYGDLRFWGSHPLTDPMFSSSRLAFLHDGAAFMRVQKTEYVVRSPIAMRHLRVCWKSTAGDNCGACNNCIRTMLALEALGVLEQSATFSREQLDLGRAARIYCRHDFDYRQFGYVRDLAEREHRSDIAAAVNTSLTGSRRLAKRLQFVRQLRDRRVVWRWAPAWEQWLLRTWVD
jgi:hypothetical protein